MSGSLNNTSEQVRLKRIITAIVVIFLIFTIGVLSVLLSQHLESLSSKTILYGVWEEQDVPGYARDSFEVRKEGIYISERIVDTRYSFDGRTLLYEFEGKTFEYKVKRDEDTTELLRVSPTHYQSVFYLRGGHKSS